MSVQSYELMGSARMVSLLSASVAILVLTFTLLSPSLMGVLRRRWVYTIGAFAAFAAALCFASFTVTGQATGVFLRNAGASLMNVTLSLYIMDQVKKSDLVQSESMRLTLSTLSWTLGPAGGIWLLNSYGPWGPQIAVMVLSVVLLALFWILKLREPLLLPQGTIQVSNPLQHVKKFASQSRLRLAWTIAFARSCFWATLFIYGPLVLLETGQSKQFAGVIISLSQVVLFAAYGFGKLADRLSVRFIITLCLSTAAFCFVAAAIAASTMPTAIPVFLLMGAFFCTGLDAVGGVPFLRAVRSRERRQMAAVYRSFIELSELIPGLIFFILLIYFNTTVVFGVVGAFMFAVAGLSWQFLPKKM